MPDRISTWEDVGARVAAARTAAGLTQAAIAERVGVHRTAIARIERGQRHLDALELVRLADALGRSVSWFVSPPPPMVASHRRTSSDDRDVALVEDQLEQVARDVELLLEIDELTPAPQHHYVVDSIDAAIRAAERARAELESTTGPLHDVQDAAGRLGLLAFSLDLGPQVVDGAYVRVNGTGVAVVNGSVDPGRRRFNVAHELGHHLLGDEYSTDFAVGQSREDRERLINVFAIHFLAPGPAVRARWDELMAHSDDRSALIRIAAEYRLSWSAACGHAHNLGLIDQDRLGILEVRRPGRADYLELGIAIGEELEPPSVPSAFARAVLGAYRRHKIGTARAVELLRGTIAEEDLEPTELPLDDLRGDFQRAADASP